PVRICEGSASQGAFYSTNWTKSRGEKMNIILDTNIFIGNLNMESDNFNILFDYLRKTGSTIILPQIVYQELKAVYKRKLEEKINNFQSSKKALEKILLIDDIDVVDFNLENKVEEYIDYFLDKINIKKSDIVLYKPNYLEEIVKRATERKKPFTEKGEEFRDGLLWLTILDIVKNLEEQELIFISRNTKEFADKEKLHPDLVKETITNKVEINYYNSLKHFIKNHASNIKYITYNWIEKQINNDDINDKILDILETKAYDDLLDWIEWKDYKPDGYVNPLYVDVSVHDFFVYEMTDETIYVEAKLMSEVEIEAEVEVEEIKETDELMYEYKINPKNGDMEQVPRYKNINFIDTEIKTKYFYPEIEVIIGLTIKNKKPVKYNIKEWDIY
ncbi:PIN domain-containing protein, partial [Natronospora cellulosivora (SeqCode)]